MSIRIVELFTKLPEFSEVIYNSDDEYRYNNSFSLIRRIKRLMKRFYAILGGLGDNFADGRQVDLFVVEVGNYFCSRLFRS